MIRIYTYVPASQVLSADLNAFQDRVVGASQATGAFFGYRPVLSSTGTTNLVIGYHGGVVMGSVPATAITGGPSAGSTVVLAGLAANTWYYVYAYNSASYPSVTVAYEYNTTTPSADLTQKSTDNLRTYIGCFRTDGSSNVIPFRTTRSGKYLYRWSKLAGTRTDLQCLSAGTDASYTDVILRNASAVSVIPPHARIAQLRAMVNGAIGTFAQVRTNGDTLDAQEIPALLATPGMAHFDFEIETDSALTIEYRKNTATDLTLYVTGFEE